MSEKKQPADIADFFRAAESGDAAFVRACLAARPEWAKEKNPTGWSAVEIAAWDGRLECLEALLPMTGERIGAPVGQTFNALMMAAWQKRLPCLLALLPWSDARAANWHGETALMMAAGRGCAQSVRALLPASDPKAANRSGATALMEAAERGERDCVAILLPVSDAHARNGEGRDAADVAAGKGEWECADLLAASMSPQKAEAMTKRAPNNVPMPLCRAVVEGEAISAMMGEKASPRGASAKKGEGVPAPKARRI